MKNAIAIVVLAVMMISLFSGIVGEEAEAGAGDENYTDNSNEYSDGPGVPPEGNQDRDEPRTRNKDT
jgi:hypothetical protein